MNWLIFFLIAVVICAAVYKFISQLKVLSCRSCGSIGIMTIELLPGLNENDRIRFVIICDKCKTVRIGAI